MNRILAGATWLACVVLAASLAHADPRDIAGPPAQRTPELTEARRAATVAAMEAWLKQLVGRYRYTGVEQVPPESCTTSSFGDDPRSCTAAQPREAYGTWDCIAIGAGAGVHCIFGSTAPLRISDEDVPSLNMDSPTMLLFGFDPDVPTLRYMRIDDDGIAYEATGSLRGNTASFSKPCRHGPVASCLEIFRIELREGKHPQAIIDWIDAASDYNSIALLQIWMRPEDPVSAGDAGKGGAEPGQ